MHVHLRHSDYLIVIEGSIVIGLKDLRPSSATKDKSVLMRLDAAKPQGIVIPPGVAHAFYCLDACLLLQAVTEYWDPADELGCRWDDPAIGISWPEHPKLVSPRDNALPPYFTLVRQVEEGLSSDS